MKRSGAVNARLVETPCSCIQYELLREVERNVAEDDVDVCVWMH